MSNIRGLVLLTLLSLLITRADAQPDSTGAAPDTGWVEVGGPTFGSDDPFADLPSAEDEGPVSPRADGCSPTSATTASTSSRSGST